MKPDLPKFPTMLRKMWSGTEVQKWLDENVAPLFEQPADPVIAPSDQEIMRIAELVTHRHAFRIGYLDIPKIVRAVLAKYADCRAKAEPVASIESLPYAQLLAGAAAVLSNCAEALQGEGDDCLEHEARSMAEMIDLELQKQQTLSERDR